MSIHKKLLLPVSLLVLMGCSENADQDPTNASFVNAEGSESTAVSGSTFQSGSLPMVIDLLQDESGSDEFLSYGNQVFADGSGGTFIGIWDITGPWDSVENDIAFLRITEGDDSREMKVTLYDYDGDEAGDGLDCFLSATTGNAVFQDDLVGPIIDGPYPLNGVLTLANGGDSMNMLMLDLLDVNNDGDHDQLINYTATRANIDPSVLENICSE